MRTWTTILLLLGVALAAPLSTAEAVSQSAEQKCRKMRLDASAKYLGCQYKTFAKIYSTSYFPDWHRSIGRCHMAYQGTWAKLQATPSLAGSSCTQPRFVDNGDGTVTDNLTNLVWEKKTDDGGLHDKDDFYTFSTGSPWKDDGTIFTTFLSALNGGSFGGSQGWRLPSAAELATILLAAYPCNLGQCIDPVFGPVLSTSYATATSPPSPPILPQDLWWVSFHNGGVEYYHVKDSGLPVRAVRGGL